MTSSLSAYLEAIARYPLLDKNQEIILARRVQRWLNDPAPTPSVVRSGKRAQDKMVQCNLRLVVSVCKKYMNRVTRSELLDLIQEGTLGLTRGVQKYDPERGYALSTYVYWWIRQSISRYIQTHERLIRLPNGGVESLIKLRAWVLQFSLENKREPTVEECAKFCKITPARMRDYLNHSSDCASLDKLCPSGNGTLLDICNYEEEEDMLDRLAFTLGSQFVRDCLAVLSEKQFFVITNYYGVDTPQVNSFQEIGKALGVSRERVRQLHNEALLRLRIHSAGGARTRAA